MNSTQLPLYEGLRTVLENPRLLRRGRVLAVYLTHSYAHTSAHSNFLSDSLKGVDMSLWNTAQALGWRRRVVPIMAGSRVHEEADPDRFEVSDEDERPYHFFQSRFQGFACGRLVAEHDDKDTWGHPLPEDKVMWLNSNGDVSSETKQFREVQTAHPTYGNEPGIGIDYTRAAMLIGIPPYRERGSGTTQSELFWEGMESDGTEDDEYVYEKSTSGCSSDDEMD